MDGEPAGRRGADVNAAQALGEFELLVLLAVLRLGPQAYAVSVRREIAAQTGREVSRGAVYVTLDRLAHKGLLRSRLGEPTAVRGGKAKRFFVVEPAGREAARAALGGALAMAHGLQLMRR